jgi:NAD+ kinase
LKELAHKIRKVGLIGNSGKPAFAEVVRRAAKLVASAGRIVCCDSSTSGLAALRAKVFETPYLLAREVDMLMVFGGDGTMLRAAREIAGSRTPVLGINIGSLGFLTAVSSEEMPRALEQVWGGHFQLESRHLLEASGKTAGGEVSHTALNDLVIGRGAATRLIELDVAVDGQPLTRYRCDGLIVSSPTGSTAYSLAAGGAIVFPTAAVLELTPICPHTLSNRSLIVPRTSTISVKVLSSRPQTILSADGQTICELACNDLVTLRSSRKSVRLMQMQGSSFPDTLRRKLHWRGTPLSI